MVVEERRRLLIVVFVVRIIHKFVVKKASLVFLGNGKKLKKNDFAQDRTGDVLRVKQMP